MQYSLDKISNVAQRNDLLTRAQRKRRDLDRKRRNLGESIDAFRTRMNRIEKELADVRSSLAALTPAYHAMPEGKDKATLIIMIKRLELRQARLQKQAYTCNVAGLLAKELRYNRLDSQVSAMNDYVDALERTGMALSQPIMHIKAPDDLTGTPAMEERFHVPAALLRLPGIEGVNSENLRSTLVEGESALVGGEMDQAGYLRIERAAS